MPQPHRPGMNEIYAQCHGYDDFTECAHAIWLDYEYKLEHWVDSYIPSDCYTEDAKPDLTPGS